MTMPNSVPSFRAQFLARAALRGALTRMLRGKVAEADLEDIVQNTLADAHAARSAPDNESELRAWVFGIARHKLADHYRARGRRREHELDAEELVAPADSQGARDLARWADRAVDSSDKRTLEWMMREASGETLEEIAHLDEVPAPRVRQRVSRLRRLLKSRWAAELAAVAAILLALAALLALWNEWRTPEPQPIVHEPTAPQRLRAAELRRRGLDDCAHERWRACVDALDAAKRLDPTGDEQPEIAAARQRAARALAPSPGPVESVAPPEPSAKPPAPAPSTTTLPAPRHTTSELHPTGPGPAPRPPSDSDLSASEPPPRPPGAK